MERKARNGSRLNKVCGEIMHLIFVTTVILNLGVRVHYHIDITSHRECELVWVAEEYLDGDMHRCNIELALLGQAALLRASYLVGHNDARSALNRLV